MKDFADPEHPRPFEAAARMSGSRGLLCWMKSGERENSLPPPPFGSVCTRAIMKLTCALYGAAAALCTALISHPAKHESGSGGDMAALRARKKRPRESACCTK